MATSGSYDFLVTRNEIINDAYTELGYLAAGETLAAEDLTWGARKLNMLVKQWQGKADFAPGLKAFSRQRITLFLAKGQQRYLIGPASTDARATTQYGRTTIRANEALGQTVLDVTARTDTTTYPGTTVTMTDGDIIGVEQNDGTIHWTTISSSSGSGPTVTLAVALAAAADAGNYVWWFTARAQRPVYIESAVLRDENYKDRDLDLYSEVQKYERIADKGADGDPGCLLVEYQRLNTALTCDVQPNDVTKVVNLTALYPAEDFDAATDNPSFPQEWFRPLVLGLAIDLAPGCSIPVSTDLRANFNDAFAIARNVDPETSDAFFEPDRP